MTDPSTPPVLLSIADTATATGLTERQVRQLVDGGHLQTLRVGRVIRVHRVSLDAFLAGNLEAARA